MAVLSGLSRSADTTAYFPVVPPYEYAKPFLPVRSILFPNFALTSGLQGSCC